MRRQFSNLGSSVDRVCMAAACVVLTVAASVCVHAQSTQRAWQPQAAQGGSIVSIEIEPSIGNWSVWLDNGIRMHTLDVDGRPGEVVVSIRIAGGSSWERDESAGLTEAALFVLDAALSQQAGARTTIVRNAPDHVELRWSGAAGMLEQYLAGVAGVLSGPLRVDADLIETWRRSALRSYGVRTASIEAVLSHTMWSSIVSSPFTPLVPPSADAIDRVEPGAVAEWLARLVAAPLELTIVGDLDADRATSAGLAWFGPLPARPRIGPAADALGAVTLTEGPWRERRVSIERGEARSMVVVGIVTSDLSDLARARALLVATGVATARLNMLRGTPAEAGGPAWDRVDVFSWPIGARADVGVFACVATGPGGAGRAIERDLRAVLEDLVREGPTEGEIREAAAGHLRRLASRRSDPGFWADAVLSGSTFYGRDVARILDIEASYDAVTAELVRSTLSGYAKERGGVSIIVESTIAKPIIMQR